MAEENRRHTSTRSPTPIPFPIRTPRDLLSKARRELNRLAETAGGYWGEPDETALADLTINTAWSLWHVTDWIAHGALQVVRDVVPRQMKKAPKVRADRFQRRLRVLSPDLRICWGLALRFKHFELETEEARSMFDEDACLSVASAHEHVEMSVSASDLDAIPLFSSTPTPVGFSAMGSLGIDGPSSKTMHPKVTYRKQPMRLTEVYGRTHQFLDDLLKKHGL